MPCTACPLTRAHSFPQNTTHAQARAPALHLWVGVAAIDYMALAARHMRPGMSQAELGAVLSASGEVAASVAGVSEAAAARGFKARTTAWGECV